MKHPGGGAGTRRPRGSEEKHEDGQESQGQALRYCRISEVGVLLTSGSQIRHAIAAKAGRSAVASEGSRNGNCLHTSPPNRDGMVSLGFARAPSTIGPDYQFVTFLQIPTNGRSDGPTGS